MNISDKDIKKICSDGIFRAGCDYYKEGRVHLRVRSKEQIVASVDSDKLYNVHVDFSEDGKIAETFCTCPYYQTMGANCKHIVATLKTRQMEIESGEDFFDDNDRVAGDLCSAFEKLSQDKTLLHVGFIFNINTNRKRECSYSMSVKLGYSDAPISGIESFLDAFISGSEYKLSKHRAYSKDIYTMGSNEEHILRILSEAYQNRAFVGPYYSQKQTVTEFGAYTARRIFPLLKNVDVRYNINGMPYPNIQICDEDPDILVDITATDDNINISIPQSGLSLVPDGSWFLFDGDIYMTTISWRTWYMPLYNALATESRTQIDFKGANSISFAANVLPQIRHRKGVVSQGLENVIIDAKPKFDIYFDRYDDGISAVVIARYGNISLRLPDFESEHDKIIVRCINEEKNILSHFKNFTEAGKTLYLSDNDELYEFLTRTVKKLSMLAEIHPSESFLKMHISGGFSFSGRVSYNKEIDLLEVGFETEISASEIAGILNALRHKKDYYRMKNGSFLDVSESFSSFDILNSLDFSFTDIKNGKKSLSKYNALYLSGLVENGYITADDDFEELIEEIRSIRADIPDSIDKVLRGYQKTGVHWMKQLSELGFGGILADDMGLGKTLEVIAFVASEKKSLPTLVVCPSSLTYNWLSEINRFAPDMKAMIIDGTKEERIRHINNMDGYDFVVTSYPLLRRDILEYHEHTFAYCIIDESQHIKNPKTLSSKSVKKIRAEGYFALSGTPIENSLSELWSVFDFIMPGYLFSQAQFAERYENPIAKYNDDAVMDNLRKKIKPFVLRRMKSEVLKELPDKIENTFFAELDSVQKKLYMAYLASSRKEVSEAVMSGNDSMKILSLLMRLRQICCHPKLIDESYDKESGKLNLLEELVQNGIESGHRILIFSQFTSMLSIIRERLSSMGIDCFYLDGQTPSRERTELSDRFNSGEKKVFLVSLKAGGTGLNLIGADMVIHYDPWWNPAITDQASDRAYRIGQTKAVHIIKLASKGTIEEQILKLQEKKRNLADGVIRTNSSMISNLTKEEILELFK